jgi:hypothetical protein
MPEVPEFVGDIKESSGMKTVMAAQYRTMNRGGYSIYEEIRRAGYEPWVSNILDKCLCGLNGCSKGLTTFGFSTCVLTTASMPRGVSPLIAFRHPRDV